MPLHAALEEVLLAFVDRWFARWPQPRPGPAAAAACRLIAHRGDWDQKGVIENSLAAFERAANNGVWGIECDLRWSCDGHAVLCHDPDFERLFGDPRPVSQMSLHAIKRRFPAVTTLDEVIARYGGRVHLMIELKGSLDHRSRERLERCLRHLTPGRDFHLLSFSLAQLNSIDFLPPDALLPIARLNLNRLGRSALQHAYAGISGHYLLVSRQRIRQHQSAGQHVGIGIVASPRALYRSILQKADWVFVDHAAALQQLLRRICTRD